jgi:hypothetical protein
MNGSVKEYTENFLWGDISEIISPGSHKRRRVGLRRILGRNQERR